MATVSEEMKRLLAEDPELRKAVEAEAPLRELQIVMIKARQRAGLTQDEVARRMGTNRTTISRLESVNNDKFPTLQTIQKYAQAVGCKIKIAFAPEVDNPKAANG